MRRALALVAALAACRGDEGAPIVAGAIEARSPCPGTDEGFAFRALRLTQGRRPQGVRELAVLAGFVRELDALGLPGRELVARGLAQGERYVRRWRTFLLDHLRVPRIGGTAFLACYGLPGPAGADPRLAALVRARGPEEAVPADMSEWTMADLIDSSLRLDDPTPLLRAHVLTREVKPVGGNNVSAVELERAQRVFLGRGFEAAYLGRRVECLACHDGGGATAIDHAEPALDRSWPVIPGVEDMVYGPADARDEERGYAAFRVAGFVDGPLRPWGSRVCGGFTAGDEGDLVGATGHLGGPLPAGAQALDLEARLREGLAIVAEEGLTAAEDPSRPAAGLAGMVAVHLADAVWREASGHPLTLAHGQPRNPQQQQVLRALAEEFVDSGHSLRALVTAAAIHPYLDLAEPQACAGALPPVLAPFYADNDAGDGVRREDPWILLDSAADALGWRSEERLPLPHGWSDEPLLRALGVYLDDSEPGHRGVDLVAALAWEDRLADGEDPQWRGAGETDVIAGLVALAAGDALATVEELVVAVQDRLIQETGVAGAMRGPIEALLGLELTARAGEIEAARLTTALRRFAGSLLSSPQFVLTGLAPPPGQSAPRLVLPGTDARSLCESLAPAIVGELADVAWRCTGAGPALTRAGDAATRAGDVGRHDERQSARGRGDTDVNQP